MFKLITVIFFLILLYLLMQGWNVTMYRQFPALVIRNYWFFVGLSFLGYFILRMINAIK